MPHTPDLAYFNVFGDIHLVEVACLTQVLCWQVADKSIGDIAILPGPASPYGPAFNGGARFLYGETLKSQNWEWAMRRDIVSYGDAGGSHQITNTYSASISDTIPRNTTTSEDNVGSLILAAPENHINLGDTAKGMTNVLVADCHDPAHRVRLDIQLLQIVRGRLYNQPYICRP